MLQQLLSCTSGKQICYVPPDEMGLNALRTVQTDFASRFPPRHLEASKPRGFVAFMFFGHKAGPVWIFVLGLHLPYVDPNGGGWKRARFDGFIRLRAQGLIRGSLWETRGSRTEAKQQHEIFSNKLAIY